MFLTRKKADKEIKAAVEATLSRIPDLSPQVELLGAQVEALQASLEGLRADQAERETELARENDGKLRALQEAHAEALDRAIAGIVIPEAREIPEFPRYDTQILLLNKAVAEVDDTVRYLLDSPATVIRETVKEVGQPGVRAMYEQHMVRPMGAK